MLAHGRPEGFQPSREERIFRLEHMTARRATIGPQADVPDFQGLGIWVSIVPETNLQSSENAARRRPIGALFLIEDFLGDDNARIGTSSLADIVG